MAHPKLAELHDKKIGDITNRSIAGGSKISSNEMYSTNLDVDSIHSTDHLKAFMSFICDKQVTDLNTAIRSSVELFKYCIPARGAVLSFYGDLFSEYNTYYWIHKKRLTTNQVISTNVPADQHSKKCKIDYVGELTRRFYETEKVKLADAREDQLSDVDESQPSTSAIGNLRSPPAKMITPQPTGPDSPSASSSHMSPVHPTRIIPISGPRDTPTSRRESSCHSNDVDQTPMSPSVQDIEAPTENQIVHDSDHIDIFSQIETQIPLIRSAMEVLMEHYKLNIEDKIDRNKHVSSYIRLREKLRNQLTSWSCELILQMNMKFSETAAMLACDTNTGLSTSTILSKTVDLWVGNPANKLLIDLIIGSHNNINQFLKNLANPSSCNSNWLLAYIMLEISKKPNYNKEFALSLEHVIASCDFQAFTSILAYLSDNNPSALTNFPKNNIPFLISLCHSSTSLLNVLASEIPDEINPEFINNLARDVFHTMPPQEQQSCIEGLIHCIIAAPNSYKLFLLALDIMLSSSTSPEVKSATQVIIDSVISKIQQHTTPTSNVMMQPIQAQLAGHGLLTQINIDPNKLIQRSIADKYVAKKVNSIFQMMSLLYGNPFASSIIGHHLNLPECHCWRLLKPLLIKFNTNFGDDGSTLVSQTLIADCNARKSIYWDNLFNLVKTMPAIKLDLNLISQLLADKLCAATLDIKSTAQLLRLCSDSLEKVDHSRIQIATKHKLCMSIATCFFLLLEIDGNDLPEILSYIRISLTCMSSLRQSSVASHILCRALLDRSLIYGYLFNSNFNPDIIGYGVETSGWARDDMIKLSRENLKVSLGHRFRRLPNRQLENNNSQRFCKSFSNDSSDSQRPDRQSINSYLLIEAFKSSINNIDAFANLFVEFHCPVMFDKHAWPTDDALRVINERNLGILRKFEQVPPFWDLFELIGQSKCLKNCLVLVKALLAAHLAIWASATTKTCHDKFISTARLIPPLAQSGLVPEAFGLTVEVFPHLSSGEVFSVLSDIWQYLKDTNLAEETDMTPEQKRLKAKTYLDRLRLFMCQHLPGPTYVKIFKELAGNLLLR